MASLTFTVVTGSRRSGSRQQGSRQQGSRQQGSRQQGSRQQRKKPFCKICFDSGKTEQEYTNHYLKDRPGPQGKVVCPTLLATECRYCHDLGHFKSHCPVLVQRDQEAKTRNPGEFAIRVNQSQSWCPPELLQKMAERDFAVKIACKQQPQQQEVYATSGAFAALDSDSDKEDPFWGPQEGEVQELQGAWQQPLQIEARKAEIGAELEELRKELAQEEEKATGLWSEIAEIDDIKAKIDGLEEELVSLKA